MKKLLNILLFLGSFGIYGLSPEDIIDTLDLKNISAVEFLFTDLNGGLRSVSLPRKFVRSALSDGLKFDGSSIPGFSNIFESDMHLQPDLNTFRMLQVGNCCQDMAIIICNVKRSENQDYEGDARTFLINVCNELEDMGYMFNCGPELEFYLLDKDAFGKNVIQCSDNNKYFDSLYSEDLKRVTISMLEALNDGGLNIEKLHHEVAPGQYEVSLKYAHAVELADSIVLAKYVIKSVADKYGFIATFMPKPIFGQNGSGMHVHYSLWDIRNNRNAFYSKNDDLYLSDTAKAFLNGNVKYLPFVSAFINPTVNSYKRLVPGYEAPVYVCVGKMNRSAAIRIPLINVDQPNATRAELRAPDSSCNPYLALGVIAATGLQGIKENNINLQTVSQSLYKLSSDEIKDLGISALPASLEQALKNLDFGAERFVGQKILTEFKRQKSLEVINYNMAVHWWELDKYI